MSKEYSKPGLSPEEHASRKRDPDYSPAKFGLRFIRGRWRGHDPGHNCNPCLPGHCDGVYRKVDQMGAAIPCPDYTRDSWAWAAVFYNLLLEELTKNHPMGVEVEWDG